MFVEANCCSNSPKEETKPNDYDKTSLHDVFYEIWMYLDLMTPGRATGISDSVILNAITESFRLRLRTLMEFLSEAKSNKMKHHKHAFHMHACQVFEGATNSFYADGSGKEMNIKQTEKNYNAICETTMHLSLERSDGDIRAMQADIFSGDIVGLTNAAIRKFLTLLIKQGTAPYPKMKEEFIKEMEVPNNKKELYDLASLFKIKKTRFNTDREY